MEDLEGVPMDEDDRNEGGTSGAIGAKPLVDYDLDGVPRKC